MGARHLPGNRDITMLVAMAIGYYGCLAKAAGFGGMIGPTQAALCPDGAQYAGKIVNGVEPVALFGAARLLMGSPVSELQTSAEATAATGPFALDPLMFGLWRD